MKTKMTPEEALSTLHKWRKCTIPMKKHTEAVCTIRKALKEKARQDAIINMLKETIAYETSLPETRIDEEGNTSFVQKVVLRQMKDLEERKRKLLRDWILRECFPKELKALEQLQVIIGTEKIEDLPKLALETENEWHSACHELKEAEKKLKALKIIKEKPEFPMYVEMYENAYEMIMDRPGFAVSQSAEELQKEFETIKEFMNDHE